MKVEIWLFTILVGFFVVIGFVYGYFTSWLEPVGSVALFLCAGLAGMIALFLWWTARKLDVRPEDDPLGDLGPEEEFGFFSPHSWWPLALGASGAVVFLGLAVGWWMVIIGAPLLAIATVGWTFEYFRGQDAV